MYDGAKWQFCNKTHFPSLAADLIASPAFLPYPCPRDNELKLFLNPNFSARLVISNLGSAPGERININGVKASASLNAYSKLN